ncbi:MAG: hypothetical protein JOY96_03545 [Verrucomicrobia bacterium]|nr:hypothetical protein [Verrucomicrobiota bacterium]MBV9674081.1 hypothetical protein [Verrucomicrobiota bacterium]
MSAAVEQESVKEQAPMQEQEVPPPPTFQELEQQINDALAAFKKRQSAITAIREALSKSRKTEADCLQRSLTDDDPKLIEKINRARVEIEV